MIEVLAFFSALENPMVWVIILIVALLLFGRKLPEVGRSLGQGIVEFKKGLKGLSDEVEPIKKDVESAKRELTDAVKKDVHDAASTDKPKPGGPGSPA